MRIGKFLLLVSMLMLLGWVDGFSQFKLYEATFNGGVVTGGYSNGATVPSGSGSFNVTIPAGSTIRRAYLMAGRCGNAPNLTVTLNGSPFTFSASNIITTGFQTIYGGTSAVHAIDVTASISAATSAYTIAVPVQSNTVSDKFPEFYLYIAFDNAALPAMTSAVYCNTVDLTSSSFSWTLPTTATINNGSPVGLAVMGGYATTGSDCENVAVNGTPLGSFGGQDWNASSVWGCMAGFQYYNNVLTGYNDDNANQAMSGTDALSNIQAVIPGTTNSIPVTFTHCGGGSDNHVWALFLSASGVILDGETLDFIAEANGNQVDLTWASSTDKVLRGFEVERSFDGENFVSLGNVNAKPLQEDQSYSFPDKSPQVGSNWYRIKVIGTDGVFSFSEIREVVMGDVGPLAAGLSPNPIGRGSDLTIHLPHGEALDWVVYSIGDGREVLKGHHLGGKQVLVSTSGLAQGMYGIRLQAGDAVRTLRFVVGE